MQVGKCEREKIKVMVLYRMEDKIPDFGTGPPTTWGTYGKKVGNNKANRELMVRNKSLAL